MGIGNKKESLTLLLGDIIAFVLSLWLALLIRNGELPDQGTFFDLFAPFAILFIIQTVSFFIAGLYEKQRIAQRRRLPELLFKTEIFNSIVAIVFFYSVPYFGVAPKTILFFYIVISLALSFFWRIYALSFLSFKVRDNALLVAGGEDAEELINEINNNPRYSFQISETIDTKTVGTIDFEKDILKKIEDNDIRIIIIDSRSRKVAPVLPHLYSLIFSKIHFLDFYELYEEIFDRLPISVLQHGWFLENISTAPHVYYDAFKRLMDIVVGVFAGVVSLVFYPFVMLAIKLDDKGDTFITQDRVGARGSKVRIYKFRTMSANDSGRYDANGKTSLHVTKVGNFLRKTRIDELPQLWNLIKGDISLIGPRPELPTLVSEYRKQIDFYNIRHIIKPGLSGWAQMYQENHPHHGIDVEGTKEKLAYDLFYIKHRSFSLDLFIALKTIKTLLSRVGK